MIRGTFLLVSLRLVPCAKCFMDRSLLKNVSGGKFFADACVLRRDRLVSVVQAEIFSAEECQLCEGSFICCIEPGESGGMNQK